jgi:hypothetical protein
MLVAGPCRRGAPDARTDSGAAPTPDAREDGDDDEGTGRPAPDTQAVLSAPVHPARSATDEQPIGLLALEQEGDLPPGPWRWRWVWPTPGRPAGMALIAADGALVLWSPGGFATPDSEADGRPTPDVANALASLPELSEAAAGADTLRAELERARAVAEETRRLLNRAAGTVDDEIGRVHNQPDTDPPTASDA